MITRDNFNEVLGLISEKDKKRLLLTSKEYVVIELHITNACVWVTIKLTDNWYRYQNVSAHGNCILEVGEVVGNLKDLLTEEHIKGLISGVSVSIQQKIKNYTGN